MSKSNLEAFLIQDGLISVEELKSLSHIPQTVPWAFAKGILRMGILDEAEFGAYISSHTNIPIAPRGFGQDISPQVFEIFPKAMIPMLEAIPIGMSKRLIEVCVLDPLDTRSMNLLEFFLHGYDIAPVIAAPSDLYEAIRSFFPEFIPAGELGSTPLQHLSFGESRPQKHSSQRNQIKNVSAPKKAKVTPPPQERLVVEGFEDLTLDPVIPGEDPFALDNGLDRPPSGEILIEFEGEENQGSQQQEKSGDISVASEGSEEVDFDFDSELEDEGNSAAEGGALDSTPDQAQESKNTVEYEFNFDDLDTEIPSPSSELEIPMSTEPESAPATGDLSSLNDDLDFFEANAQLSSSPMAQGGEIEGPGLSEDIDLDSFISEGLESFSTEEQTTASPDLSKASLEEPTLDFEEPGPTENSAIESKSSTPSQTQQSFKEAEDSEQIFADLDSDNIEAMLSGDFDSSDTPLSPDLAEKGAQSPVDENTILTEAKSPTKGLDLKKDQGETAASEPDGLEDFLSNGDILEGSSQIADADNGGGPARAGAKALIDEPSFDSEDLQLEGLEEKQPSDISDLDAFLADMSTTELEEQSLDLASNPPTPQPAIMPSLSQETKVSPKASSTSEDQENAEKARFAAIINQTLMKISLSASRKAAVETLKKQLGPLNINLSFKPKDAERLESFGALNLPQDTWSKIEQTLPAATTKTLEFHPIAVHGEEVSPADPKNNCYFLTLNPNNHPEMTIVTLYLDRHIDSDFHRLGLLNISRKFLSLPDL